MSGPRAPVVDLISELLMKAQQRGLPWKASPELEEFMNPTQNLGGRNNVAAMPGDEFPFHQAGARPTTRNSMSDPMDDADPEFEARLAAFIEQYDPNNPTTLPPAMSGYNWLVQAMKMDDETVLRELYKTDPEFTRKLLSPERLAELEAIKSSTLNPVNAPDAGEMLGDNVTKFPGSFKGLRDSDPDGPLFIWVHQPDGRKARLDGPFSTSDEAFKVLNVIMKENPDTYSRGVKFTIEPNLPE